MDGKDLTHKDQSSVESTRSLRQVTPLVDIYETGDHYVLEASMPGVSKENVRVKFLLLGL